jgi:hypothetical protein
MVSVMMQVINLWKKEDFISGNRLLTQSLKSWDKEYWFPKPSLLDIEYISIRKINQFVRFTIELTIVTIAIQALAERPRVALNTIALYNPRLFSMSKHMKKELRNAFVRHLYSRVQSTCNRGALLEKELRRGIIWNPPACE